MVPNIFHGLSKNAVVHELKKVCLKLILYRCFLAQYPALY